MDEHEETAQQVMSQPNETSRRPPSSRFEKALMQVSRTMAAIGAVMFGVMMILSVTDVTGRYFFRHPVTGAVELVGFLLVIGAAWGMGYCQVLHMHISIDVLSNRFPRKVQSVLGILAAIICAVVAGLISWQAYAKADDYFISAASNRTDILSIPLWPFAVIMAIGFTWLCIVFLADLVKAITGVFRR
jgi:TRAP-type C4-dicarboxylate transport system permease small subunit